MRRMYSGYLFRCRVCGKEHLMDNSIPHQGIFVRCVEDVDNNIRQYNANDFRLWFGNYYDVGCNLVSEVRPTFK